MSMSSGLLIRTEGCTAQRQKKKIKNSRPSLFGFVLLNWEIRKPECFLIETRYLNFQIFLIWNKKLIKLIQIQFDQVQKWVSPCCICNQDRLVLSYVSSLWISGSTHHVLLMIIKSIINCEAMHCTLHSMLHAVIKYVIVMSFCCCLLPSCWADALSENKLSQAAKRSKSQKVTDRGES